MAPISESASNSVAAAMISVWVSWFKALRAFGRFRVINPTRSLVSTMMLLYSTTISLKFWSVISALVKNADDYLWINIFKVGVLPLWISVFFNDLRTQDRKSTRLNSSHVSIS